MQSPDDSVCWTGGWAPVDPLGALWAQSAMLRTIDAMPRLHPWRLGDDKGSRRSLLWCGETVPPPSGVAILCQTAPDPSLPLGDPGSTPELLSGITVGLPALVASAAADAVAPRTADTSPNVYRRPDPGVRQWVGGLAQLHGAWLPPLAILPRSERDIDDPGTEWSTESIAFAGRHTVHSDEPRFAADLLAPHVTALILDHVPPDAAVTVAGDALHVWWEYDNTSRQAAGKVASTVEVAAQLRDALPSFVLSDYPDHSEQVEDRLAERAAEAAAYRASRRAGRVSDPTLQRIYSQAQADYYARKGSG
ncbi:MAG TPA: hypothetical protein VMT27_03960 [Actinomycetes bacterium]|nr:hypothetical protein [Actinomycetes bacterium]